MDSMQQHSQLRAIVIARVAAAAAAAAA